MNKTVFRRWSITIFVVGQFIAERIAADDQSSIEWIDASPLWRPGWYNVSQLETPIKRWAFNEGTGERLMDIKYDGWDPEWDFDGKLGPLKKRVGLDQVMGSSSDSTRTSSRSTYGFTTVVDEQLQAELYCLGAKDKRSFFGPVVNRYKYTAENNKCIASCYEFAQQGRSGGKRRALVLQKWLQECRVPLTHVMKGTAMATITGGGPTATVRLPKTALKDVRINHRDNLVDVLMRVRLLNPPLKAGYEPFSVQVVNQFGDEKIDGNLTVKFTAGRGVDQDNRLSSRNLRLLNSIIANPMRIYGMRRSIDQATGPYKFLNESIYMNPKFRAAASVHYASYETTSFMMSGNTGAFVDELDVVEILDRNWVAIDVTPIIKRLWSSDNFEFTLLSTSDIVEIDTEFIFHKAIQWVYNIESPWAANIADAASCEKAGFTWCSKIIEDSDYFDLEYKNAVGVHRDGRCGVPKDACFLINMNIFGS